MFQALRGEPVREVRNLLGVPAWFLRAHGHHFRDVRIGTAGQQVLPLRPPRPGGRGGMQRRHEVDGQDDPGQTPRSRDRMQGPVRRRMRPLPRLRLPRGVQAPRPRTAIGLRGGDRYGVVPGVCRREVRVQERRGHVLRHRPDRQASVGITACRRRPISPCDYRPRVSGPLCPATT